MASARSTEKTHAPDGSKTMSELHREEERWREQQPLTTRCTVWGCDWVHDGTVAEGRDAFRAHRAKEHPTADRIALAEERRNGNGDRARMEARAEERRQQLALRALDDGTPQRDLEEPGREPQTEPADDVDSLPESDTSTNAPSPAPAAAETGSRPAAWSRQLIIAAIRRWHDEHGEPPRANDWTHRNVGYPSQSTVIKHFGRWRQAIEAAGFVARGRGGQMDASRGPAESQPVRPGRDSDDAHEEIERHHDLQLVKSAIDADDRHVWIDRLHVEAERLELRAAALRQIAHGLQTLESTEAA